MEIYHPIGVHIFHFDQISRNIVMHSNDCGRIKHAIFHYELLKRHGIYRHFLISLWKCPTLGVELCVKTLPVRLWTWIQRWKMLKTLWKYFGKIHCFHKIDVILCWKYNHFRKCSHFQLVRLPNELIHLTFDSTLLRHSVWITFAREHING